MKYWERWIGDWKRKTAHLSAEAKGIYGELLDHEYATHKPLPLDLEATYRIAGARSPSESSTTDKVLAEFYLQTADGYINKRAQEEIARRLAYIAAQRGRAIRRWEKPDPATGEIKPARKSNSDQPPAFALPDWLNAAQWAAWIAIRPARARTPAAQQAAVVKLDKMRAAGSDPNVIVGESLANGWQGLFAPGADRGRPLNRHGTSTGQYGVCRYCSQPATQQTNGIPHCGAARHLDFAIARNAGPSPAAAVANKKPGI